MHRRYTVGSILVLGCAVITALAVVAPALMGQTQSQSPFQYIHEADIRKQGPAPFPAGPATLELVLHGRNLVLNHGCGDCHNAQKNDPNDPLWLSGSRGAEDFFQIGPFKTYARNLTPDNTTGLGRISARQIFNALRYGLRPSQTPDVVITSNVPGQGNFPANPKYLAPPMPWPAFRHTPDDDLWAMIAYLKHGLKPITNQVPDSEGPPDFWASSYTPDKIGLFPAPTFPAASEQFNP
jgi:hypothetical protein